MSACPASLAGPGLLIFWFWTALCSLPKGVQEMGRWASELVLWLLSSTPEGRQSLTHPCFSKPCLSLTLLLSLSATKKEMLTSRDGGKKKKSRTCKTFPHLGEFTLKFVPASIISKLALNSVSKTSFFHTFPDFDTAAFETSFCTVLHCSLICYTLH